MSDPDQIDIIYKPYASTQSDDETVSRKVEQLRKSSSSLRRSTSFNSFEQLQLQMIANNFVDDVVNTLDIQEIEKNQAVQEKKNEESEKESQEASQEFIPPKLKKRSREEYKKYNEKKNEEEEEEENPRKRRGKKGNKKDKPVIKKRKIMTRARAAKYTRLNDLLNSGILKIGQSITLKGKKAHVMKEGWIEYGEEMYPGPWTWCNAVAKELGSELSLPELDASLNTQTEEQLGGESTTAAGKPLAAYQELFEKQEIMRDQIDGIKVKLLQKRRLQNRIKDLERLGITPSLDSQDRKS